MSVPDEFLVTGKRKVGDKNPSNYTAKPEDFISIYKVEVRMNAESRAKVKEDNLTNIIQLNPDLGVSTKPEIDNDKASFYIGSRDPKKDKEEVKNRLRDFLVDYTPLHDTKPDDITVDGAKVSPKSIDIGKAPGSRGSVSGSGGLLDSTDLNQLDSNKAAMKLVSERSNDLTTSLIDDVLSGDTMKILKLRLATGKITLEDFEKIKNALQS